VLFDNLTPAASASWSEMLALFFALEYTPAMASRITRVRRAAAALLRAAG